MDDPPAIPTWIDTVAQPLDVDSELGMAARAELLQLSEHADPEAGPALAARLKSCSDSRFNRWRPFLLWSPFVLAVLFVGLSIPGYLSLRTQQRVLTQLTGVAPGPPLQQRLGGRLSPHERLLVFGDTTQPTEALARKALWDLEPDNPAYFADYLAAADPPPPEFLETARQLDPANGWFLLVAAGLKSDSAVRPDARPRSTSARNDPHRNRTSTYQILDREQLAEAIDLVHEAAARERIRGYETELLERRLEVLPPERDFVSRVFRLTVAAASSTTNSFRAMRARDAIAAEAQRLAAAKNHEELRRLIRSSETLCRRLAEREGNLIHGLIAQAITIGVYEHLLEACETAHLQEEAKRLRPVVMRLREMQERRRETADSADSLKMHGEILTALATANVFIGFGVDPPTTEEMRPGRLMNYALFERLNLSLLGIALLLSALLLFIVPLLRGRLTRQLGRRFASALGPRDWIWILSLGVIAPLLYYLFLTLFTPLGCRDWSLVYAGYQPAATQASLLPFLVLAAIHFMARRRLGRRLDGIGLPTRGLFPSLLPVLLAASAIAIAGLLRYAQGSDVPLLIAGGLGGLVLLWFLLLLARYAFGSRTRASGRTAVVQAMSPALAWTAVLALALTPLARAAERHFLARDTLLQTSPETLGMGRIEAANTAATYRVLREALGTE